MAFKRLNFVLFGVGSISAAVCFFLFINQERENEKEDELREANIRNQLSQNVYNWTFYEPFVQMDVEKNRIESSDTRDVHINEIRRKFVKTEPEEETSLHHILFGIGSSLASWSKRGKFVRTWWDLPKVRGYVWMDGIPDKVNNSVDPPFQVSGDIGHLRYNGTGLRDYLRLARIVKDAFMLNPPNVRWFVMGDDDTYFSAHGVTALLSKYDHNELLYIGSQSETHWQNNVLSHEMAFGGGGFAVSWPLAAALNGTLDDCMERYTELWGSDQRVSACVSELGVHMTREKGFHQCDLNGPITGLLEAHPLDIFASLHHLERIHPVLPDTSDRVSALKELTNRLLPDPIGFLQLAVCHIHGSGNWTISIAWGYSVKVYPKFVRLSGLERIERTFTTYNGDSDPNSYNLNTRKVQIMAPSLDICGIPFSMYATNVILKKDGSVISRYSRQNENRSFCQDRLSQLSTITVVRSKPLKIKRPRPGFIIGPSMRRQCCNRVAFSSRDSLTIWLGNCPF